MRDRFSLFLPVVLSALAPASALAAAEVLRPAQGLQVLAGLAVVLGLIALATWGARRLQGFRGTGTKHIRIVEGMAVGAREKLLLVEVGEQRVLLGMCPGRIQTLAQFPAGEQAASFEQALAESRAEVEPS